MSTKKIATKHRPLTAIARDVEKEMSAGHDVVLRFARSAPPRRVLDTINILLVTTRSVSLSVTLNFAITS